MRGGDHDTGLHVQPRGEKGHRRRRDNAQAQHIRAGRANAGRERRFEQIAGDARIAPHRQPAVAGRAQHVHSCPRHSIDEFGREVRVRDAADAVSAE